MASSDISRKTVSDEQADEQEQVEVCPECSGDVAMERREVVCSGCGLVVREEYVELSPRFQLGNVEKDEDRRGLETGTAYMLDENGSPYREAPLGVTFPTQGSDWRSDGKDNRVSDREYDKWDDIKHRQVKYTANSRDNWRTDALQDIKTIGRCAGVPSPVCERAAELFRAADDAGLPGGRMAFESLAVGTVVVAAREAGLKQSIDTIAQWARTPHERACAGARKVRIGLELADRVPPCRRDAVQQVVDLLGLDAFDEELPALAEHLMDVGDAEGVGPGTPRMTVAASAVYAALKLLSDTGSARRFVTRQQVVDAVEPVVETSKKKTSRYNCELIDAYEARHGTDDPAAALD